MKSGDWCWLGFVYVAGFQIFTFLVTYREAYVQRYGVAHLGLPLVFMAMTLVLMALLIGGWRLASREKDSAGAGEDGFRAAFEKANIGMALLTPSGEFIHANEALVGMLGRVAGSNIRGLVHADDLAELGQAWEDMGNGDNQSATTWMRWRASDGRAIWGRLSLSFLRSAQQRPARILLQLEDSTRAHHNELRLERLIQARDEFVAAIAEDIRVPVGALLDLTAQGPRRPGGSAPHRSPHRISRPGSGVDRRRPGHIRPIRHWPAAPTR